MLVFFLLSTLLVLVCATEASPYMMETTAIYRDETCNGSAVNVLVVDNDNCTAVACSPKIFGDSTNYYETTICYSTDRLSYNPMEDLFLGQTLLEGQAYSNNNCTDEAYKYRQGLLVGECEPFTTKNNYSVSATPASDRSVAMSIYNNTACTDLPITTYALRSDTLDSHLCYNDTGLAQYFVRYYVHQDNSIKTRSGASSNYAAIVGGVVAGFAVMLAVAALVIRRKQSTKQHQQVE